MTTDAQHIAQVSALELNELHERWNNYRNLMNPGTTPSFDPLTALRLGGAVLHAVGNVLDTAEYSPGNE